MWSNSEMLLILTLKMHCFIILNTSNIEKLKIVVVIDNLSQCYTVNCTFNSNFSDQEIWPKSLRSIRYIRKVELIPKLQNIKDYDLIFLNILFISFKYYFGTFFFGTLKKLLFSPMCELCWKTCKTYYMHAQSCPTLCDAMDCSMPGSSVHGILQGKNYWSELPCPPRGDLPQPRIEPVASSVSSASQEDSWLLSHPGSLKDITRLVKHIDAHVFSS